MNSTESNITQGNTTSLYMFDNEYSGELRRQNHTEESEEDFGIPVFEMPPVQFEDHDHNDHHKGQHAPDHQQDHHHGMHHKNHNK